MAIPKINEEDITAAIKYIEENGVPEKNKSSRYVLVTEEGKQYPINMLLQWQIILQMEIIL